MTKRERLPLPFITLSFILAALGASATAASIRIHPPVASVQLLLVLIAVLVSEFYLLQLGSYYVSLSMPLILTALVIGGPGAASLAAAVSSVSPDDFRERKPVSLFAFNLGQIAIASAAAGWVYVSLRGLILVQRQGVSPLSGSTTPGTLVAFLGAAVVAASLNILLTSVGVYLARGVPFVRVLRELIAPLPTQMALALVGLLMAQVLSINPIAFPLFLFPLFLARQVYQRYASMRDAYLDMVRSLVGALEAKDPYTRGHSERVAQYALELAHAIDGDERTIETVEQAALLHDIGKLSLSFALLSKSAPLTDAECASVRRHPWVGAEMVQRIPALRLLSEPIRAHHERIDGSGYPAGLIGEEIPLVARILAVADAFDAMTTDRAYRPAMTRDRAVDELLVCAGEQFDEQLVRAFVNAGIGGEGGEGESHLEPHAAGVLREEGLAS